MNELIPWFTMIDTIKCECFGCVFKFQSSINDYVYDNTTNQMRKSKTREGRVSASPNVFRDFIAPWSLRKSDSPVLIGACDSR